MGKTRGSPLDLLVAMEPLHITEFASKRYYEKLEQLPKEHQQQQNDSRAADASSSTFILPIRQAEQRGQDAASWYGEHFRSEKEKEKEKEKRGLFGRLRSSKPSVHVVPEPQLPARPSAVSVASTNSIASQAVKRKRYVSRSAKPSPLTCPLLARITVY